MLHLQRLLLVSTLKTESLPAVRGRSVNKQTSRPINLVCILDSYDIYNQGLLILLTKLPERMIRARILTQEKASREGLQPIQMILIHVA